MKHVVVGTAGHIDHGKTELVKALTGINTDRFKEEQERGITIDIGFAPLELEGGVTLGFVDVPGHEKFIKNMLAGIWGIDLLLMVIAADESVKPQTLEHFDICSLLQVKRGVVALTKADLVDEELMELATLEVRELVRGSFLDGAPIVPVSAKTGRGLDALRVALREAAAAVRPGRPSSLLRMPVDRAFTMRGFGTVVTGTLVSGRLEEGDEIRLYPAGGSGRVRGIQVHGKPVSSAGAGQRTAVNLQGVGAAEAARGMVLGRPGEMASSSLLDVKLRLLPRAPAPLRDMSRVRFHQGTVELLARVKLLGREELRPGEEGFAQLRLEKPGCLVPLDRFVLRRYSPTITIGGGVVLDAHPRKHRAHGAPEIVEHLERLERATPAEAVSLRLAREPAGIPAAQLAGRSGMTVAELEEALTGALAAGEVARAGSVLVSAAAAGALSDGVSAALSAYHRANPLRPGMPREELRERALGALPPDAARALLEGLAARGSIRIAKDRIALASHAVTLSKEDERAMTAIDRAFEQEGLNPPDLDAVVQAHGLDPARAQRVLHLLLDDGRLVRIADGKVFHAGALEALKSRLWGLRGTRPVIDITAFKELTGTSRKNAIPLLEHLDSLRITRRVGSDREILPPAAG